MRGLATLKRNCVMVATLLGDRKRGERLFEQLQRRMQAVAADIPTAQRKRALYVSAYAGQLFGGAAGTSYHDVLTAAGLIDVAAPLYRDWIHYDPEQVLLLDPEIIVTSTASASQLCRMPALDRLRACGHAGGAGGDGVIDIDEAAIGNPGLGMLDAAEAIRDRVYGPMRVPTVATPRHATSNP
jgi:iron complex transport system substrate-binding protein